MKKLKNALYYKNHNTYTKTTKKEKHNTCSTMSRQLIYPSLTKIASKGNDANEEIMKAITKALIDNDIVMFKDITEKEELSFPREIYCDAIKHKALRIFFYLFVESRTQQEEKNLKECYNNIQDPKDAGMCGKRSANAKPMIKTFNMEDYCIVPQSVFNIASQHDDKRILQFVIACGVPIDIETYNLSRRSSNGWCSSLAMSMTHGCRFNEKKAKNLSYT